MIYAVVLELPVTENCTWSMYALYIYALVDYGCCVKRLPFWKLCTITCVKPERGAVD